MAYLFMILFFSFFFFFFFFSCDVRGAERNGGKKKKKKKKKKKNKKKRLGRTAGVVFTRTNVFSDTDFVSIQPTGGATRIENRRRGKRAEQDVRVSLRRLFFQNLFFVVPGQKKRKKKKKKKTTRLFWRGSSLSNT
eukprot:TRINITY_DN11796_c0_g1_i1.p3 TRINITY_DN11796_c0_g1~~TRINITY_DN11796_c0_g1_i1.p3  ORF type:complete len:136 (+),score=78.53 TRINITY_DN11796_c0_g1_i1:225-632(+)